MQCSIALANDQPMKPLSVVQVTFNDKAARYIRQITIHFNQAIAHPGAIVTQQQRRALTFASSHNIECRWRYIDSKRLACELAQELPLASEFVLSIDSAFQGVDARLEKAFEKSFETPFPAFALSQLEMNKQGYITGLIDMDAQQYQLTSEHIKLQTPAGELAAIDVTKVADNGFSFYRFSSKAPLTQPIKGNFQLVMLPGLKLYEHGASLDKRSVSNGFYYSTEFEFLGFACWDANSRELVKVNSDLLHKCSPESINLQFSQDLPQYWNAQGALSGGEFNGGWGRYDNGIESITLNFYGHSHYELDLSKIVAPDLPKLSDIIEFKTGPAKAELEIPNHEFTTIARHTGADPYVLVKNKPSLTTKVAFISNKEQLLAMLHNGKPPEYKSLKIENRTKQDSQVYRLDIPLNDNMATNAAMAFIDFPDEKKNMQVTFADFNLVYENGQNFLLRALEWRDGAPISDVNVSVMCSRSQSFVALGKTDKQGILTIGSARWQQYDFDTERCWIWAEQGKRIALLQSDYGGLSNDTSLTAHAWSIQPVYNPGDVIEIAMAVRQLSQLGLNSVSDLSNYQWSISHLQTQMHELSLDKGSKFGLFSDKVQTDKNWKTGIYNIHLSPKGDSGPQSIVGSFSIEEHEVPEYEITLGTQKQMFRGQPFEVSVSAKRLNGSALKNAKVTLTAKLVNPYFLPPTFAKIYHQNPPMFEFNKLNTKEAIHVEGRLDDDGQFVFTAPDWPDEHLALGEISFNATVSAPDGEVLTETTLVEFYGRDHYIAMVTSNDDNDWVEVHAFDFKGQPIQDLNTQISFHYQSSKNQTVLASCQLDKLPAKCKGPRLENVPLKLNVLSGKQKYAWTFVYTYTKQQKLTVKKFEFDVKSLIEEVEPGQLLPLVVTSPRDGKVLLSLFNGPVRIERTVEVKKGGNDIQLQVPDTWVPKLSLNGYLIPKLNARGLTSLGQQQVQTQVSMKPKPIELKTDLAKLSYSSGEQVTLEIKADTEADSVTWLVNEGLWQLTSTNDDTYNLAQQLFRNRFNRVQWRKAISLNLLQPAHLDDETGAVAKYRRKSGLMRDMFGDSGLFEMVNGASRSQVTKGSVSFAQSHWLGIKPLVAGKPAIVTFRLPKVPGRWKLVTIAASDHQFAQSIETLTTQTPIEYRLDSPKRSLASDKGQVSVTVVNRQKESSKSRFTLNLNGKPFVSQSMALSAGEQQILHFELPAMPLGNQKITLTSGNDNELEAQRFIEIAPASEKLQKHFLYQPNQDKKVQLPEAYLPATLQMSAISAKGRAPDWLAQLSHTRQYPHQCWEQNLSRRLAWLYSPMAQKHWPEGGEELKRLLDDVSEYRSFGGMLSFFRDAQDDHFLTAYTFLVQHWFNQKGIKAQYVDGEVVKRILKDTQLSDLTRSMALLALAEHGLIDTQQALAERQTMMASTPLSQALQLLALKVIDADEHLIEQTQSLLLNSGYQDRGLVLSNDNSDRCFSIMALGQDHPRSQQMIGQVINSQRGLGHFGSTFADGVCSYVLKNRLQDKSERKALKYVLDAGKNADFTENSFDDAFWLRLEYQQSFIDMSDSSSAITLERAYYVKSGKQWLPVLAGEPLTVGSIVKVELKLNSPIELQHMAITDGVAAGFEPVNNNLQKQFAGSNRRRLYHHMRIQDAKVYFYPRFIAKGTTTFSYIAKTRYAGEFLAVPAKAQMMYNESITANTKAKAFKFNGN